MSTTTLTSRIATTVTAGDLKTAVKHLAPLCEKKTTAVDTLRALVFTARDGQLTVSHAGFHTHGSITLTATTESTGTFGADGHLLSRSLTKLISAAKKEMAKPVELAVTDDRLSLTFDDITLEVPTLEYRELPDAGPATHLCTLSADDVRRVWQRVNPARCTDDTLRMLTGVNMTFDPDNDVVEFATTDRFRLAIMHVATATVGTMPDMLEERDNCLLVPGDGFTMLATQVANRDTDVTFDLVTVDSAPMLRATFDTTALLFRPLDENFPNVAPLVPKSASTVVTFDRKTAEKKLGALAKVTTLNAQARFYLDDGAVTIVTGGSMPGQNEATATATLDADIHRGDTPVDCIAFNHTFMLDALKAVGTDTVTLAITQANRPALLLEGGAIDLDSLDDGAYPMPNGDYLHLLMPVRLPG